MELVASQGVTCGMPDPNGRIGGVPCPIPRPPTMGRQTPSQLQTPNGRDTRSDPPTFRRCGGPDCDLPVERPWTTGQELRGRQVRVIWEPFSSTTCDSHIGSGWHQGHGRNRKQFNKEILTYLRLWAPEETKVSHLENALYPLAQGWTQRTSLATASFKWPFHLKPAQKPFHLKPFHLKPLAKKPPLDNGH